jgi:hypothetical protein
MPACEQPGHIVRSDWVTTLALTLALTLIQAGHIKHSDTVTTLTPTLTQAGHITHSDRL